jgi:hypothetical protein
MEVEENHKVPYFHTHDEIPLPNGGKRVFRYWQLKEGNLTSSLMVMSDCAFNAVYDEVHDIDAAST